MSDVVELTRTPSFRLDGKRALVTGAGRGIGAAAATALAEAGAHVMLVSRTQDELENLGHVRRTHGRDDRRKVLVQITASGSSLVAEVREDMISNLLKMMEVLDPEEQKTWLQIYEKIFSYCQSK